MIEILLKSGAQSTTVLRNAASGVEDVIEREG
jgi:hypothetical protein